MVLLTRAGKDGEKWVSSHQRIMHTNDVLCLATIGNKLISGGKSEEIFVHNVVKMEIRQQNCMISQVLIVS